MNFISRLSTKSNTREAVDQITDGIEGRYDFGILFVSSFFREEIKIILDALYKKVSLTQLIGCTCAGVIGSDAEIENDPSIVFMAGNLPGVKIVPFAVNQVQLDGLKSKSDWHAFFDIYPNEEPGFILLPDPFMFDVQQFLDGANIAYPGRPVVGGIASAANRPGENTLLLNENLFDEGAVGLIFTGAVDIRTIVTQGCRPIGENYTVTKAEKNIIFSIAHQPVLESLGRILEKCSARDRALAQQALFMGIVMDEYRHTYGRGDFLIRGVIGIDQDSGALAIADYIEAGQTVQFHIRDSDTASEDMNALLEQARSSQKAESPKGALIFNCNGRGLNMFKSANHDIKLLQKKLGPLPAAGFFCAGEIGPIGKLNYLHGFTNSMALFYPKVLSS